ncbi:hypothetical protein B2K_16465 [Paenibacillus mucilaginosus K02]|uniref:Uncharacterized protein n=1 Tax=Paenibacillus mucilaginosus K02 TaxID=997761 RepID=I0BIU8_9BACL|nr:hypothetical protein B2K_16465 [Paenibacillus mucilaginosus K02]
MPLAVSLGGILCMFRLYWWEWFTVKELRVTEVEDVTQLHIKNYIQERQRIGKEVNRTINNNIATFFEGNKTRMSKVLF